MGVKDLWSVLAPVGRHMPLKHLTGQTLAVDLSIWVCETQSVKKMQGVVTKPHLRNLFFRISHLSQLGVKLVFAIEGVAPDLKLDTMSKRQNSQFPGRSRRGPRAANCGKKPARSHFNSVLRECCEMLDCLGIPYVQSSGEAEAMCAVLNSHGLVDGCLTNDGDVFLYGARVVYRNFTMNTKDPHVEVFRMDDLERELGLNREKLVAMAILVGCDYMPQGVPGVGREQAGRLMQALEGEEVLKRMEGWRQNPTLDELQTHADRKKVSHCVYCHHPGSQRHHEKWGCTYCKSDRLCTRNVGTSCPCEWHEKQRQVEMRAVEFSIRQKAIKLPNFPPKNVIQEFMLTKDKVTALRLTWRRPNLFHFQRLSGVKLEWEGEYALAKVLPLITLHDMTALLKHALTPSILPHAKLGLFDSIAKSRVRHGVSCYEVEWNKLAGDTSTEAEFYVTVESQDLFARCFPLIVEQFEQDTATKRKGSSKGKSKKRTAEEVKQMTDADAAVTDVMSGLDQLQISTERGDAHCVLTGASAAGPRMQGTDKDEQLSDDSCILLDSTGDVNAYDMSPTHTRHDTGSPVTDTSDTDDINPGEHVQSVLAEEYSDSDDDVDVFLSLSERLRRQKLAGLKVVAGTKPLTTSCTRDVNEVTATRTALSNQAPVEPVSKLLTERRNYAAATNVSSVMTNQLPPTPQQLCSRQLEVEQHDLFNPSRCVKLQTEDSTPKASGHTTHTPQISAADRFHEQNDVCFDLRLQDDHPPADCRTQSPCKMSDGRVVDSLATDASVIPTNAHIQQISLTDDSDSNSCTDDELGNSSDTKKATVLVTSARSHDNIPISFVRESDCSQPTGLSSSRSSERTRSCWVRNVVMSPELFDSSDDDDGIYPSTLTPSVGMLQNADQSLCGISRWDVETPMHSTQHDGTTGPGVGGNGQTNVTERRNHFGDSSFSWHNLIDHDGSPALRPTHSTRVNRTALDDSAFASFDSNDNLSSRIHCSSQSLSDSACGDIGDFRLRSSLLSESLCLNDSTDLDDSVFIRPSTSDNASKAPRHGSLSRGSFVSDPNSPSPCQKHCYKGNGTPPQAVRGCSDNVPIKCDIQVTRDLSTVNSDISPQPRSPVCLADRLKLRLAKTNKAHLVSCLSRDMSTTSSSFNNS